MHPHGPTSPTRGGIVLGKCHGLSEPAAGGHVATPVSQTSLGCSGTPCGVAFCFIVGESHPNPLPFRSSQGHRHQRQERHPAAPSHSRLPARARLTNLSSISLAWSSQECYRRWNSTTCFEIGFFSLVAWCL